MNMCGWEGEHVGGGRVNMCGWEGEQVWVGR